MGACLGQCCTGVGSPTNRLSRFRYPGYTATTNFREEESVESNLVRDGAAPSGTSQRFSSLLSLKIFKKKGGPHVELELTERIGRFGACDDYSRLRVVDDSPTSRRSGMEASLRTPDGSGPSKQRGRVFSTPASSLDLEWEHEAVPPVVALDDPDDSSSSSSPTSSSPSSPDAARASNSTVSSPRSLEWDPVEARAENVDVETEGLLREIERLTDKALEETGAWTGCG